jgi:hypothetical protein
MAEVARDETQHRKRRDRGERDRAEFARDAAQVAMGLGRLRGDLWDAFGLASYDVSPTSITHGTTSG